MNTSKNILKFGFAAIVAIGLSSIAFADQAGDTTIAIKFVNQPPASNGGLTTTDVAGVTAVQTANWNLTTDAADTDSGLIQDISGVGSATTANITWSAPSAVTGQFSNAPFGDPRQLGNPSPSNANARLAYGYLSGGTVTLTLNNLPTQFANGFSLYIYAVNGQFAGETNTFTVTGASPQNSNSTESGSYVANEGYLLFSGLSGTSVTITDSDSGISSRTAINGIELVANPVATPEPSTYALLLGGFLLLGLAVRHRQNSPVIQKY